MASLTKSENHAVNIAFRSYLADTNNAVKRNTLLDACSHYLYRSTLIDGKVVIAGILKSAKIRDAQDIANETVMKIWRKLPDYTAELNLSALIEEGHSVESALTLIDSASKLTEISEPNLLSLLRHMAKEIRIERDRPLWAKEQQLGEFAPEEFQRMDFNERHAKQHQADGSEDDAPEPLDMLHPALFTDEPVAAKQAAKRTRVNYKMEEAEYDALLTLQADNCAQCGQPLLPTDLKIGLHQTRGLVHIDCQPDLIMKWKETVTKRATTSAWYPDTDTVIGSRLLKEYRQRLNAPDYRRQLAAVNFKPKYRGEQDARQRRINQLEYIVNAYHGRSRFLGKQSAELQATVDGRKFNPVAAGVKGFKASVDDNGNRSNIAIKHCRAAEVLAEYGDNCEVKPEHFAHCPHSHDIGDHQSLSLITDPRPHELGADGRIQTVSWEEVKFEDKMALGYWPRSTAHLEPGWFLSIGKRQVDPRNLPELVFTTRLKSDSALNMTTTAKLKKDKSNYGTIEGLTEGMTNKHDKAAAVQDLIRDAQRSTLWDRCSVGLDTLAQWRAEDAEKLHQKRLREEAGIIDQPHECTAQCKRIISSPTMDSDKLADLCWSDPAKHCEKYLKKLARDVKAGRVKVKQYDQEFENVTRLMKGVSDGR